MIKNDGGPAFPRQQHPGEYGYGEKGMSLRDYFAGQALAGLLAPSEGEGKCAYFAMMAYKFADAMLAEREKNDAEG